MASARSTRARRALLAVALTLSTFPSSGHAGEGSPRRWQTVDFSVGIAPDRGTAAISWNQLYAVWPGRLVVGVGPRFTTLFASGSLTFRTGDPRLIGDGDVNRLVVPDARVSSLNLQILVVGRLVGPLEAGADIDVVGVSFGPGRTGGYQATDPSLAGARRARVSSFDLLLGAISDRGQLNSEFFLGLRLGPRWTVRAGVGHVATEYRTVEALDGGNRRFRRYTTQGFVGVSRRFR